MIEWIPCTECIYVNEDCVEARRADGCYCGEREETLKEMVGGSINMTTLELAKLVHDSGCEVDISPSEIHNAVFITARNKDKVVKYIAEMSSVFQDPEDAIDQIIKMSIYYVKDINQ